MRNIKSWHKTLVKAIEPAWTEAPKGMVARLCEIELGLYVVESLLPDERPTALWGLLTGYQLSAHHTKRWTDDEMRKRAVARHLLPYFRGAYTWEAALEQYMIWPEFVRGYNVEGNRLQRGSNLHIASDRFDCYEATLSSAPASSSRILRWADPGDYVFEVNNYVYDVNIPSKWVDSPPTGYELTPKSTREPFYVQWNALLQTAQWMDEQISGADYVSRMEEVKLELWNGTEMQRADALTVEGMLHLAGMVSAGKSTLMEVLTVWAARREKPLHVTLVLGDVISVLEWAARFERFGLRAAPVVGGYSRETHLNRLHRLQADQHPEQPMALTHSSFRWLGTACALNGSRHPTVRLSSRQLPCTRLRKAEDLDKERSTFYACPLYKRCGVHTAARELQVASIWVVTPASLVYTRVPAQMNAVSMRMGELVSRRSDLIIVDEADRVQTQLDNTFSPSEVLAGSGGEPWLHQLDQAVQAQIRQHGRSSLGSADVESWLTVQRNVQLATDKLYVLFMQKGTSMGASSDYFTGWTLWEGLTTDILKLKGLSVAQKNNNPVYKREIQAFNLWIRDPFSFDSAELDVRALQEGTRALLTEQQLETVYPRLEAELRRRFDYVSADDTAWKAWSQLLAFALLAGMLSWGVDELTRNWDNVKEPLDLGEGNRALFFNPPSDYDVGIPAAPMGNVLAFQYSAASDATEAGVLQFFRIAGVGRAWLLSLHKLFADEGNPGPNVILLSGTSWAGDSPLYHVQYPIEGVLHSSDKTVAAIAEGSRFRYEPVIDPKTGKAVYVSGTQAAKRTAAFDQLVAHFTRRRGPSGDAPSRFEEERDRLEVGRQRIMILVGSYAEAETVRLSIVRNRPDWEGSVINLVRDDDDPSAHWTSGNGALQRGQVSRFADTNAWILVAPLLAVERGHNILNEDKRAAIGAAYFWVRPHPRPDDLTLPVAAVNAWAIENDGGNFGDTVEVASSAFRQEAYAHWRSWLGLPWIYSTLPKQERSMVTWTQLVTIWQVIGRLVRGGSPARVYFVDAAFGSHFIPEESGERQQVQGGLITEMKNVLSPYFEKESGVDPRILSLVRTLYGPFYEALKKIGDV
jgi:hypothetical protein